MKMATGHVTWDIYWSKLSPSKCWVNFLTRWCQKRKQKEKSEARALDPNNECNDELFFQAAQQAAPRQAEEVYDS